MFKVSNWLILVASLLLSGAASLAGSLPAEFIGSWEAYVEGSSRDSHLKCTEREGVVITQSYMEPNVEAECGQIDNVRPSGFSNASIVNMTCFASEGRKNPLKYKDVQIWSVFKVEGNTFLTQTSVRNPSTFLYKKCELQLSPPADNVPYRLAIGYDNENKIDATERECRLHVESVTAWDKAATDEGARKVCASRQRHIDAYSKFQTDYRSLIENFSSDNQLRIHEAISNLRGMIKNCMNHKFSLTTGGHNIMINITENDIASDCLNWGSSLLNAEIKDFNVPQ
jgi:hypothetical protein